MRRSVLSGVLAIGMACGALAGSWSPAAAASCQASGGGAGLTFAFSGNGDSFQGGNFGGWSIEQGDTFSSDAFSKVKIKSDKVKLTDKNNILRDSQSVKATLDLKLKGTPSAFTATTKLKDRIDHISVNNPSNASGSCS
jgi:hypothetical protein